MDKTMERIRVSTSDGLIVIEGNEYEDVNNDKCLNTIVLPPDQVDGLIAWLQEAKQELLSQ